MIRKLILLSFLLITNSALSQEKGDKTFENANAAYNAGQYEKAVMHYKEILENGMHSASLYYNLANAYYRLNQVGESIFYYEKAKQLDPQDQDIILNSTFAQNMAIDAIEQLPKSQITRFQEKTFDMLSQEGWAFLSVLLAWILVLFWALYIWNRVPAVKRIYFISTLILGLLLIGSLTISYTKSSHTAATTYGILFNKKIKVWAEPNSRAEVLFLLHEGTKTQLLDRLQEWQKIRIANGSEGWIKDGKVRSLEGFK